MPTTAEHVDQEIEQLRKLCRELSERVTHLQKRVVELEQAIYEDEVEQEQPEE